jgi:cellulose synthase (UDP-forming)
VNPSTDDPRLLDVSSESQRLARPTGTRVWLMLIVNAPLSLWYFSWLLAPQRIGNRALYGMLIVAELFNLIQAAGFWWTCADERSRRGAVRPAQMVDVDVLVPVYGEPVDVVEPTIAAAVRMRGARVRVALLDDGDSPEMEALAARYRATYIRRVTRTGAKAGNLNHALRLTSAPAVAVFDCDHVPDPAFLEATLGYLVADSRMAFVQTPQYYANAIKGGLPAAAWAQQALFFGAIARGKDRLGGGAGTCRKCSPGAWDQRTWPPTSASSTAGLGAAYQPCPPLSVPGCLGGCAPSTCCRRCSSCPVGACSSTCCCRSSES